MEAILKGTVRDFSKKSEIFQTVVIAVLAFLVPTFLAQLINASFGVGSVVANNSQIIVGTVVNTILVISALNLKGWNKTIFVVTMPSISTIMSGYVFKTASIYMVWMIPAIWLGNFVLILSFKYIMIKRNSSYFIAAIIGIIGKVAIIFGIFMLLKAFNIFPVKMISNLQKAMSLIQLITATLGSSFAFVIYKLENKKEK